MRFAKIEIHLSAILFLGLCAYSGFLKEAFLFLGVFFSHELGHLFWIKIFGGKINTIHLTGIGGIIDLEPQELPFWQHLFIDSGGISVNLLLALTIPQIRLPNQMQNFLIQYNRLILGFNLFPIYPLDGFQFLFHLLNAFFDDEYLYDLLFYVSLFFLVVLCFIAFLSKSLGLMLILVFLFSKQKVLKKLGKIAHLKYYRFLTPFLK